MIWDICPDATRVNQSFGATDYPYEWRRPEVPGGYFHAGIDIGADGIHGKPVYATRDGLIVPNRDSNHRITQCAAIGGAVVLEPYLGLNCVCLLADEGVTLEYGHLDSAVVSPGQRVRARQLLGYVGTHGASCGDHLHLEVRSDGANQGPPWSAVLDPNPWLQAPPLAPISGAHGMIFSHPKDDARLDQVVVGTDGALYHRNAADLTGLAAASWEHWGGGPFCALSADATWNNAGTSLSLSAVAEDGTIWLSARKVDGSSAMDWKAGSGFARLPGVGAPGAAGVPGPPGPSYDDSPLRRRLATFMAKLAADLAA